MRAVTKVAIREARLKEIKHELLNSQKLQVRCVLLQLHESSIVLTDLCFSLQSYFEDNPRDLQLLRHDKSLHTVTRQAHLQNVPDYLGVFTVFITEPYLNYDKQ